MVAFLDLSALSLSWCSVWTAMDSGL
jgi:hypothetical protein